MKFSKVLILLGCVLLASAGTTWGRPKRTGSLGLPASFYRGSKFAELDHKGHRGGKSHGSSSGSPSSGGSKGSDSSSGSDECPPARGTCANPINPWQPAESQVNGGLQDSGNNCFKLKLPTTTGNAYCFGFYFQDCDGKVACGEFVLHKSGNCSSTIGTAVSGELEGSIQTDGFGGDVDVTVCVGLGGDSACPPERGLTAFRAEIETAC
eukprot:91248_1